MHDTKTKQKKIRKEAIDYFQVLHVLLKKEKKSDRLGQNAQRLMDSKRTSEIYSTCNRNPGRVKQRNNRMLYL